MIRPVFALYDCNREIGMVTRKMVAERAGVSEATVSYVLNNTKKVTDEVRKRVIRAAGELNYHPDRIARSLVSRSSGHVVLLVESMKDPYCLQLLSGAQRAAMKNGYIVTMMARDSLQIDLIAELGSRRVDGLLLGEGCLDEQITGTAGDYGIEVVTPGTYTRIESGKAYCAMVEDLMARGHRKIAFLSGRPINGPGERCYRLYRSAMEQNGLECPEELTVDRPENGVQDSAWGEKAADILLSGHAYFTAWIVGSDLMAMGALKRLRSRGYPMDRKIITAVGSRTGLLDYMEPQLPGVDEKGELCGKYLMEELIVRRSNKEPEVRVIEADYTRPQ